MNNFIELLGLKMNEYDIHDGDALLLYKNMGGIYIIYNDITKEVYIGKSQNLGQRIDQHKNSHNFTVKDLVKKPYTKIYVGVMSNFDYDKYSKHLEAFAIMMFSLVYSEKYNLLNIEFNSKHKLYEKSLNEGKFYPNQNLFDDWDDLIRILFEKPNCSEYNIYEGLKFLLTKEGKAFIKSIHEADEKLIKKAEEERAETIRKKAEEDYKILLETLSKVKKALDNMYSVRNEYFKNNNCILQNRDDYLIFLKTMNLSEDEVKKLRTHNSTIIIDFANENKKTLVIGAKNYTKLKEIIYLQNLKFNAYAEDEDLCETLNIKFTINKTLYNMFDDEYKELLNRLFCMSFYGGVRGDLEYFLNNFNITTINPKRMKSVNAYSLGYGFFTKEYMVFHPQGNLSKSEIEYITGEVDYF